MTGMADAIAPATPPCTWGRGPSLPQLPLEGYSLTYRWAGWRTKCQEGLASLWCKPVTFPGYFLKESL